MKVWVCLVGDGRVALDERGHDTSGSLNSERERSDVEQEKVANLFRGVADQDGGLDGGAISHSLVGVDGLAELLAVEEVLNRKGRASEREEIFFNTTSLQSIFI